MRVDRVDAGPGQTEQSVIPIILQEAAAEFACELDSLTRHDDIANLDTICINIPRRRRAVTVRDVPCAGRVLGCAALRGVVDGVRLSVLLRAREFGGPNPQVRGPGVKVKTDRHARSADLDGYNVFSAESKESVKNCSIVELCVYVLCATIELAESEEEEDVDTYRSEWTSRAPRDPCSYLCVP